MLKTAIKFIKAQLFRIEKTGKPPFRSVVLALKGLGKVVIMTA
jgi:hypothetical protein